MPIYWMQIYPTWKYNETMKEKEIEVKKKTEIKRKYEFNWYGDYW